MLVPVDLHNDNNSSTSMEYKFILQLLNCAMQETNYSAI